MPNTPVRAAAEGMPTLNRRTALAFTGAGLIASLTGVAAAAAKPSPTAALIEAHKAARAASEAAWDRASDLIDANPLQPSKVQIGRLMRGRDDDGVEQFTPIYAYCEETIEKHYAETLRHMVSMFGRTNEAAIRERSAARLAEKLADFQKQESDFDRAEEDCGITAARHAAQEASREVDRCFVALTARTFLSLEEVVATAAYLSHCHEEDVEGVDDDAMVAFVKGLAGVQAS